MVSKSHSTFKCSKQMASLYLPTRLHNIIRSYIPLAVLRRPQSDPPHLADPSQNQEHRTSNQFADLFTTNTKVIPFNHTEDNGQAHRPSPRNYPRDPTPPHRRQPCGLRTTTARNCANCFGRLIAFTQLPLQLSDTRSLEARIAGSAE